ncbi:YhgE/Pip domain-containing protein [Paenibacillus sp. CAU 1782]
MIKGLRAFMKRPTTWVGILTALMFQIIFSVIWMTGYNGITDRTDQLSVAIVNEDTMAGGQITQRLLESLPFDMSSDTSLDAAKERLDKREIGMILFIPGDFTEQSSSAAGQGNLHFYVNESNPAMIKSVMSSAAAGITSEVNSMAVKAGIGQQLAAGGMPDDQAAGAAEALSQRVISEIHAIHTVQGMNNQMVPMMMVLASYVGAMIMGMNLEQSSLAIKSTVGKWSRFTARVIINAASAVVVSLVGVSLLSLLGGQMEGGFLALWGFEFIFLLVFMFVSQMFLYLFGIAGMLLNIMMLSAQLVSSGAMVPRELLSDFYSGLGDVLPATYAVDGTMNVLFGGTGTGEAVVALSLIGAVAITVSAIATLARERRAA